MKTKFAVLTAVVFSLTVIPVNVNFQSTDAREILVINLGYAGGGVDEPPPMQNPLDTTLSGSSVAYPIYPEDTNTPSKEAVAETSEVSLWGSVTSALINLYLFTVTF